MAHVFGDLLRQNFRCGRMPTSRANAVRARGPQCKAVSGILGIGEHIGGGLVDGHRTGVGGGVGLLLTDMKLQGLKFIFRHCYLLLLIY